MADAERELSPKELERHEAIDLPDREAMTLLAPNATPTAMPETIDGGLFGSPTTEGADSSGIILDARQSTVADGTTASGSESGELSTTEADRSEQLSQSDSAYAGPP